VRAVLIVADHASFRAIARGALSEWFRVVGEAPDGVRALENAAELRPDVVLVDVGLAGLDGFGVAEALAALDDLPQVVLTPAATGAISSR
jgi:two-component system response regulator EvgA